MVNLAAIVPGMKAPSSNWRDHHLHLVAHIQKFDALRIAKHSCSEPARNYVKWLSQSDNLSAIPFRKIMLSRAIMP